MKLRSPTNEPMHIGLTSGHSCVIGPELTEVHARFVKQALMEGCLAEGMKVALVEKTGEPSKHDLIVAAMRKMVEAGAKEDFLADGRPDVGRLRKIAGFEVSAGERDTAWTEVSADDDA